MIEPFGLPRGSVRAVIALVLTVGLIPVSLFAPPDALAAFTGIAGFVLRDYFQSRADRNREDGPPLPPPAS